MTISKDFRFAFKKTIPIMTGFIFLGLTYGIYMHQQGFNFLYPTLMALTIFGGSVEFIVANLLTQQFDPLNVFLIVLVVNSRHLFYGISMLKKYHTMGRWKFYVIFGMCDESFSINYTTKVPPTIDTQKFMLFVTLLNHIYWVLGAFLGGVFGHLISINIPGLSFVMTALFIVLFMDQFLRETSHLSSFLGIFIAIFSLILVGKTFFLPVSMLLIVLIFGVLNTKRGRTLSH